MNLFDLHCDTLTELFNKKQSLFDSDCHISFGSISCFERYSQVFAVFLGHDLSDEECYTEFFKAADYFEDSNNAHFCMNADDLSNGENLHYILSIEDARLLSGDISRLYSVYDRGVRIMTYLWSGITCIGGSFDTDAGLTPFGKNVVSESIKLGIIPDISHASRRSADEIFSLAEESASPVIASHSNSYSVCAHPRNLDDDQARSIASSGGIIGICFHAPHLGNSGVTAETVFKHIDKLAELTGCDTVCLGSDFDGTDSLPEGISSQKDVAILAEVMARHNYTDNLINKIFYKNADAFFKNHLGRIHKITERQ